jgi:hypothetical protein
MEKHELFTEWAIQQGVKPMGIAAHQWSNRGLGIIAQERLEVRP